jgi:hypothetical protein
MMVALQRGMGTLSLATVPRRAYLAELASGWGDVDGETEPGRDLEGGGPPGHGWKGMDRVNQPGSLKRLRIVSCAV